MAQGQLWVTLDAEPQGAGNELGDYFLCAGEQLTVKPGQHLVLESIEQAEQPTAFFEWSAVSAIASAAYNSPAVAVTRPLKDLGQALGMAGTAVDVYWRVLRPTAGNWCWVVLQQRRTLRIEMKVGRRW